MTVFNTQMHIVTFLITMFECMILFFALVWYLLRREDKSRLRYMALLLWLIQYNVFSGLFPDPNIGIPIEIQTILAYFGGISVSMYFVYYIYKTFEVSSLKFYAVQGSIWFLFLPFVGLFIVPYMITGDADMSRKLIVVLPFVFSFLYVYVLSEALWKRYKNARRKIERDEIVSVYVSVLLWATLPIIVYFDASQWIENSITNTGFMIMSLLFVKSAIFKSQEDYQTILRSQQELEDLNRTLQHKVKERTMQVEKLSEQRMNVFTNMVHETKTPLTLMNNCLDELVEKYGESDEMDLTKMNLAKLNRNMNNFFDVHKLERGLDIYDHSVVSNLSSILQNVVSVFTQWAKQKSINFIQKIEDDIYIKADPEALDSIASNLIENAIKYIPEGSAITIELKKQDSKAQLTVADNGDGISKNHQNKIFLPYYQVNHKKKNAQGIGMGLAIVKKTVESIGGQIELISIPKEGTRFNIHFRAVNITPSTVHASPKKPTMPAPREIELEEKPRVEKMLTLLIVEDNKQLLAYLQKKLSVSYNVYLATSGAGALERLKNESEIPNLILSDVMMDDLDGFAMVDALRKQDHFSHIPVIFLSAISDQKKRIRGMKLGAVDFLVKPFSISELKLKIESILGIQEEHKLALIENASRNLRKNTNGHSQSFDNTFLNKCKEYRLSEREVDIIQCRIAKMTYNEMADKLCISEKTVSNHLSRISEKVGTIDRMELIEKLS